MNCLPETSTDPNTFPFPLRSGIGAEVRRGDLWPVPVDETQLANLPNLQKIRLSEELSRKTSDSNSLFHRSFTARATALPVMAGPSQASMRRGLG